VAIQNFFTSRDNNLDGNTYVGQLGRLWYNPDTNSLYASDGATVGGIPVDLATGANITANTVTLNAVTSTSGNITVTGNLVISGNISPASTNKIGGIIPGPGVEISNIGLLTIDSANLPVSFGNFFANNNVLTIVNLDENMILATQGSAEIQLIGNIGFYRTNGLPPNVANRYFQASNDGQISILVSNTDPLLGAVEIVGSTTGNSIAPGTPGTMLHVTGQLDTPCRLYYDGNGDYVSWVARRWNGNVTAPTQVLAGQDVLRINATAATNAGGGNVGNVAMAQISMAALENQTATAQGSEIVFTVTPVGSAATSRVDVANITVANGVTATQFNTAGNITATGNIAGGNLILSDGGLISSTGLISTTGNISAGNVNSYVTLPAGTANIAPLVFTTGVVTTSPIAGGMNYDGRVFYATPQDSERGLIVTEQIYVINADYNIVDQTAPQTLLGASVTLSSNTRYAYRIQSTVYKTANNIALQYALGGTATLARHTYETLTTAAAGLGTLTAPNVVRNVLTTNFGTAVTVTASLNGAGYYSLTVQGKINVTTGGTWFPQIGFTGLPGAGSLVTAGSSIEVWPIGATGANVSIGNWA
jgi:hypothetical protein